MNIDSKNFKIILKIYIEILFNFQNENEVANIIWDSLISGFQENEIFYDRKDCIIDQLLDFIEEIYILRTKKIYNNHKIDQSSLLANKNDIILISDEDNIINHMVNKLNDYDYLYNGTYVSIYCKIVDVMINLLKSEESIIMDSIKNFDDIRKLKRNRFLSLLSKIDIKIFFYREESIFNMIIESDNGLMQSFLTELCGVSTKENLFNFLEYLFNLIHDERFKKYQQYEIEIWNQYSSFILHQFTVDNEDKETQIIYLKFFIQYFGYMIYQSSLSDLKVIFQEVTIADVCFKDLVRIQVKFINNLF